MFYRILTKNGVDNTNIDGARDHNFNAGRRSGIVKGALNQGNFFSSSSNTIALDTCELRLCGHRIVLDAIEYKTLLNIPSVPIRYSMIAQVVVDDNNDVSFDLIIQVSSTPLVQENLDTTGKGKFQLEIGKFTQQTDGTITDVVRTADLITGGVGDDDAGEVINIGNVTTNTLESGMEAEVDVNNRYDSTEKKTYTDFTFGIPKGQDGLDGSGINPNLLINGDFRVNQRGQTSYTHTGEQYGYTYFVDRWFAWGENPFTFDASTKTLTPNTSNTYNSLLSQWIEDVSGILGKTITYSVSANDTVYSITLNIPTTLSNNVSLGELPTSFGKLRVWSNNNRLRFDIIVSYNQSIVLNYAKVEIGSVATIFSPRPYAEELAMCQRYYQTIEHQIVRASLYANAGINFYVPLPVTLRTVPTLSLASGCGIQSINGGQIDTGYSISVVSPHHSNILHLRATKENTSYQDCVLNFQGISGVDAEIY